MSADPADSYSLGVDRSERERLMAQTEIHRSEATELFDRIGIERGWSVLDLGCGPLGVLDELAHRVGAGGHVVGIDRDAGFLAVAAECLAERRLDTVELILADATGTDLPAGQFDLVHERLVLINVPEPATVVAEMVRLTRPGGVVAVQDIDWISWTCSPEHPDWNVLAEATADAWSGDVHIGRRLPALLRHAGLVDVQVAAHTRLFRPGDAYQRLLLRFVELHRDRIIDRGTLGAAELDAAVERLDRHLRHDEAFTLFGTLFQAWGRKA